MSEAYDVAIVGGGMGGAGLGYFLPRGVRGVLLEREEQAGYHTTGRSAAFFAETYGGPAVQPLTTASKAFLESPPPGFAEHPLLRARGALHVAQKGGLAAIEALEAAFEGSGVRVARLDGAGVGALAPMLRPAWRQGGLWEPDCADMDVAALHAGFLRGQRTAERGQTSAGRRLRTAAEVVHVERGAHGWRIALGDGSELRASVLVNAGGAWADALAEMAGVRPLGIAPLRRTIAQVAAEPAAPAATPLVIDAGGDWYFKPEGDRLWVSPHDEVPDAACDAQPDEIDVATAIDRFERATTASVTRVERAWAGLRSFAPDRAPVYGFDAQVPDFFWCAGQGGSGIQTAPAAGMLCAALLTGEPVPEALAAAGVRAEAYAPGRFSDG